jgi:hypothetical protein
MEGPIIKHGGKTLHIKEQILFEDASGLTIEFRVNEATPECPYRLILYGEGLPFGNRMIEIGSDGVINGGGTAVDTCPFPYDNIKA